jgi:TonB family protein
MLILGTVFTVVVLVLGAAFIFIARTDAPDSRSSQVDAETNPASLRQAAERLPRDIEPPVRSDKMAEAGKVVDDKRPEQPTDKRPARENGSGAVRVGGRIRPPQKTKDVRPLYPDIARAARVQGVVILEVTIGVDGKVVDVKVLRSIPLLDAAALDAVKRWEFERTVMNGKPVSVIMTVTVQFTLA